MGDSRINDVDLEGTSLSPFDHVSGRDTKFDQFEPSGSSSKVAIQEASFKPDEDIVLFKAWEDITLDVVVGKDQTSTKY